MNKLKQSFVYLLLILFLTSFLKKANRRIFDVHLHGGKSPSDQLKNLESFGVYKAAVSTSWELQNEYKSNTSIEILHGLMVPCPNGKVPYSLQQCFSDGSEWPSLSWVEQNIKAGKINFLGEVLSQYHGISSSDSILFPYYSLAEKYALPVGIHTGSAGPDHGCPNFSESMGNPALLQTLLVKFPKMKVWIMHAGLPYLDETIEIMKKHPNVYTDISAINFPPIVPSKDFAVVMKKLVDQGLEDRIMFGSDNNDMVAVVKSIEDLAFLTPRQKEKIFFGNAEKFFFNN
jgi:hypothetical protein